MAHVRILLTIAALLLLNGAALAQEALGSVASVRPQATGSLGGARVTLIRGAELREGETVITGDAGEVQVIFSDQTKLVIGRGSSLLIERYLLRSDGRPEKFAVNALAGTFRFITGKGDKNAYKIATPTGTLGVRGTEFDFTVDRATGQTSVILFQGAVILCPLSGECITLNQRCSVAQMVSERDAHVLDEESDRLGVANTTFPYVISQSRLRREFQVGRPYQCASPSARAGGPVMRSEAPSDDSSSPPPPPPPDDGGPCGTGDDSGDSGDEPEQGLFVVC